MPWFSKDRPLLTGMLAAVLLFAAADYGQGAAPPIIRIQPPAAGAPPDAASNAIENALARARVFRSTHSRQPVTVQFASGVYRLTRPILLKAEDSGAPNAPLRLAADGAVRITGTQILALTPLAPDDAAVPLAPSAKGHLSMAMLDPARVPFLAARGNFSPAHPESVLLIQDGVPLAAARWPRIGYVTKSPDGVLRGPHIAPVFVVPPEKAAAWSREPYLWGGGYWTYDWAYETGPVRNIDRFSGEVRIAPLGSSFDEAKSLRYAVFNAFSEITAPGDYAVTPEGMLILWPRPGAPVESAELTELLHVSGAQDIVISGLAFDGALGDAVTIEHSSRIVLSDGLVAATGGSGVVVVGGDHDRIERMVVADTGGNSVSLTGGDRETLQRGGHAVADSILVRFAKLTRTYRAGVLLQGVGNSVSGCYIAHGPHMAILYSGNDHVIAGNEISDVVRETGDAGVIYAGRDVFSRGTQITRNYMHDIGGNSGLDVRGVYLDDFLGGNIVRGNLFVDMRLPVFLNSGSANDVSRNIFVRPVQAAVTLRDSADSWDGFQGDLYRNAGPALSGSAQPLYRQRYGAAAMVFRQPRPLGNRIGPNLIFGGKQFDTEHGASAADQAFGTPALLPVSLLRGKTPHDIAAAVERGGAASAFPFPFAAADRRAALKGLRYAGRALP